VAKSISAGLLMYSNTETLRVMLAHPGGPYFAKKDEGAWTIPKGLVSDGEELLTAAKREFIEETGYLLDDETDYLSIGNITLKSGKVVHGWAFAGDWEAGRIPASNTFCMEWPPRSGKQQEFVEIDRAEMFSVEDALRKINERQRPFIARLESALREF